ncbi:hypothetical protein [Longibacter sp.]|jgi:hypothetical protein|uniref:hypothetical protein n=1 Tax=Longibacter sp. TaxID=2045415 RepID=UPI003EBE39D4
MSSLHPLHILCSVLCLLLVSTTAFAQTGDRDVAGTEADANAQSNASWTYVSGPEGLIQARFPGEPDRPQQSDGSNDMLVYEDAERQAYFLAGSPIAAELSSRDPDSLLTFVLERIAVNRAETNTVVMDSFSVGDYPARRVTFVSQGIQFSWQFYLIGNRLYQAGVGQANANQDSTDARRFFDSVSFRAPLDSIASLPPLPEPSPAAVDANTAGNSDIETALNDIGWDYTLDADGDYRLILSADSNRTQLGWIASTPSDELGGPGGYEVFSIAYDSTAAPSRALLRDALLTNGPAHGGFEMFEVGGGRVRIFYSAYTPPSPTAADIRQVVNDVFRRADTFEKKHVGGDEL